MQLSVLTWLPVSSFLLHSGMKVEGAQLLLDLAIRCPTHFIGDLWNPDNVASMENLAWRVVTLHVVCSCIPPKKLEQSMPAFYR
jgi:hypothetical protein